MRMWQGAVGVAPVDGLVSPAYVVARPFPETDGRLFLRMSSGLPHYMGEVDKFSRGIVRTETGSTGTASSKCPRPFRRPTSSGYRPLLDQLTGASAAASAPRRSYRAAERAEAGHHPPRRHPRPRPERQAQALRHPWLGDVPEHWDVHRVKRVAQILRGKFTHRPRNDPSLYDGPYPFIQTGEVAAREIDHRL